MVHVYDYLYLLDSLKILKSFEWISSTGTFPEYLFPRFIFSFTLGLWASIHINSFKKVLKEYFTPIVFLGIITGVAMIFETGWIFYTYYNTFQLPLFASAAKSWGEWKITTAFWTISAIFLVSGIAQRFLPIKKGLELCGKYSFQILLLHGMVLYILKLIEYKYLVNNIWFGLAGFIVTFMLALCIPLVVITFVRKWFPAKLQLLLLG